MDAEEDTTEPAGADQELAMCPGCGVAAPPGDHFCKQCTCPLTHYATNSPLGTVWSEGYAFHRATSKPMKPIIFWGMWLIFVPNVIVSLLFVLQALTQLLGAPNPDLGWNIYLLIAPSASLAISIAILHRVTRNYRRQRRRGCLRCGYNLHGNTTGYCTECGEAIPYEDEGD